jgi:hypothetical protein
LPVEEHETEETIASAPTVSVPAISIAVPHTPSTSSSMKA